MSSKAKKMSKNINGRNFKKMELLNFMFELIKYTLFFRFLSKYNCKEEELMDENSKYLPLFEEEFKSIIVDENKTDEFLDSITDEEIDLFKYQYAINGLLEMDKKRNKK